MAIKSQEVNKYYIEQILLNEDNNPEKWSEKFYKENICHNDKCIGYLFNLKESTKLASSIKVLNLYLIKPEYYLDDGVTLEEVIEKLREFNTNCESQKVYNRKMNVFKNPPIKQWLDTKENWCKKLANRIMQQFNWTFDDALSEVYFTVVKCYAKGHVYMGNLGYIQTAAFNEVKMAFRVNKNRLNLEFGNCESLDQILHEGGEDYENIILGDVIKADKDEELREFEFKEFEQDCKNLLLKSFSQREIDQIINQRAGYLPIQLYRRLSKWRAQHSRKELI